MQRIYFAIDDHDAEFPKPPVTVARVELFDQPHVIARHLRRGRRESGEILDATEIPAGVKPRRANKKRERKARFRDD